jgi:virginiamycin A acetyltransferase
MLQPTTPYPAYTASKRNLVFLKNFITKPSITVGDYTYYAGKDPENFENVNVQFGLLSKLTIGKFCSIAAGTKFITNDANHHMKGFSTFPFFIFGMHCGESCPEWSAYDYEALLPQKGDTVIGNDVWFGHESIVMPGVTIGNGCVIGSRAVVTKDLPPYSIAVGNPAKVVKRRFSDQTIASLEAIAWWNWDYEKISRNVSHIVGCDIEALKHAE